MKHFLKPGDKKGRLTILEIAPKRLFCLCDCGKQVTIYRGGWTNGNIKSCGCLNHDLTVERNTKHGFSVRESTHPLYRKWCSIKERLFCTTNKRYPDYGGRGIGMYKGWIDDPNAFITWAENHPTYRPGWTIERIDVNKGYFPDNCKFVPKGKQASNQRRSIRVMYKGVETLLTDLEDVAVVDLLLVRERLSKGWELERALFTPKQGGRKASKPERIAKNGY